MFPFHDKILILAPWIHMLYYFAVFSDLFILTTSLTTAQLQAQLKDILNSCPSSQTKTKKFNTFGVNFITIRRKR